MLKFHPDPIWYDRDSGFFEERRPNNKNKKKMSSDMGSVPDPQSFASPDKAERCYVIDQSHYPLRYQVAASRLAALR